MNDNEEEKLDNMFPDPEPTPTIEEEKKSWGDKLIANPDKYRYETVAYMAASGMDQKRIAEQMDMTQAWVSTIMGNTYVKNRVKEIQKEQWGGNIETRFKQGLPKAMDVVENVISTSGDDRLRLDASKWLLEKVTGKASQQVNVEGNLLGDLISQLDEMRDAKGTEDEIVIEETERDDMDEWILNNVPSSVTVGNKGKGETDGES